MTAVNGEAFGPYRLEQVIGRGGMGVVYRAYDTRRDRVVALKRLPRELAADEHFQARFRRESRLAARLNEPHIIPIHDFGEIDGQLFLDMRLVEGVDLADLITAEGGALDLELAVDIILQVSAALSAAHNAGLMHRDIKPSNVLISGMTREDRTSPFAYLVDFGIARAIGNEGTALTSTTDWFGTVAYMAPERISGSSGDARSDIYSLACLFYQCLTGRAPFTGEALQVLFAHVNNAPPSAAERTGAVSPGLDATIRRGMAKNPEDRFQTVAQFAAAVKSSARQAGATGTLPVGARLPLVPPGPPLRPPSVPPHAGPSRPPSVPPAAGPSHSNPPPRPPSGPYAGPAHSYPPSGPPSGPPHSIPPRAAPPKSNRALVIMVVLAIVVVIAAIIAVVVAVSGNDSTNAAPTGSPVASSSTADTSGSATAQTTSWSAYYRQFTKLIGTAPGATSSAYKGADCKAKGPDEDVTGMVDQVVCTNLTGGSKVQFFIGRFTGKSATEAYVTDLMNKKYERRYWTINHINRGLVLTSPTTIAYADVTSTICAQPEFLIQFYAAEGSGVSSQALRADYWKDSIFPDATPTACS